MLEDLDDYLIVEFTDDERVAVIASNWLEGTQCAVWPPYTDDLRIRNAAKKREVPGDTWQAFPIKLPFYYETDDWDKAVRKCAKLEKQGTVESTDPEDLGRSKRPKRTPVRYGTSRSPSPQTSRFKRIRSAPSNSRDASSDDDSEASPPVRVFNRSPPPPPRAPLTFVPMQGFQGCNRSISPREVPMTQSSNRLHTPQRQRENSAPSPPNAHIQPERNGMVPVAKLEPILTGIFQALEEIKADLRSLKRATKRIDAKGSDTTELPLDTFPIETMEALFVFEERLQDQDFMSQVVRTIGVYTGRSLKEEIHNILRNVIHNDVVKHFNLSGKGQKKKKAFQVLRLYKVVRTAVFKHYPDTIDQEFRDRISDYFGGAGDRDGGRKIRQEKAQQN